MPTDGTPEPDPVDDRHDGAAEDRLTVDDLDEPDAGGLTEPEQADPGAVETG